MKKSFYFVAAIIALAACTSKIEQPEVEPTQEPAPAQKTWSVTINANKVTKALADAGSSITATWTAGDEVSVYSGSTNVGTLTAASDGAVTKFTGTITGDYSQNDELELRFLSGNYTSQDGTLEGIANSCDYSTAMVTITDVSGGVLTISDANFVSQQAITKITLFQPDGTTPLKVKSVIITAAGLTGNKITVSFPYSRPSEFYVAMANTSGVKQEYLFLLTANNDTKYYATKKVNLVNGNYYSTTLTALGTFSDAKDLSESYDATYSVNDNGIVYQSQPSVAKNIPLIVANGYSVILFNVNVQRTSNNSYSAMVCNGSANITLRGDNVLKGYAGMNMSSLGTAGIETPGDPGLYTVTISGPGNLEAYGGYGSAGIGGKAYSGASGHVHSNLVFNGTGTITATSKSYGAGIGTGLMYASSGSASPTNSCGSITINSGTIIATSSPGVDSNYTGGAGIGTGVAYGTTSSRKANTRCGAITINGGSVTATGGKEGAGIGAGATSPSAPTYAWNTCGNIQINGGTVVAAGRSDAPGIGAGRSLGDGSTYYTQCGTITIGAGIVSLSATRGRANEYIQCIGSGWTYNSATRCGDITIDAGLTDSLEPGSGSGLVRTLVR
ncbi:MAG: hypothetical protein J5748_02735 [Bacteroidales bacterium]|nr:hypothetical protein [Bacteroidales bacterium]